MTGLIIFLYCTVFFVASFGVGWLLGPSIKSLYMNKKKSKREIIPKVEENIEDIKKELDDIYVENQMMLIDETINFQKEVVKDLNKKVRTRKK